MTLNKLYPTTLRIFNGDWENGFAVTSYRMDLDENGIICINHGMIIQGTVRELLRMDFMSKAESRYGLDFPTREDREYLYEEMRRGATGLYTTEISELEE